MTSCYLSLEATLTSLYAPELRFSGRLSGAKGKTIRVSGEIGGQPIVIIQAVGCIPDPRDQSLRLESEEFSFILAWRDLVEAPAPIGGWAGLRALVEGLYPFDSQIIKLRFAGVGFQLTTSLHMEIPHYLTRYYRGTRRLQHVFAEGGRRAVSYMGGICEDGESFGMHLHYKALDAFRRMAGPALTMISVVFLNLIAVLAGGDEWRSNPPVIFGLLSINAAAFAGLAAIRVGSTQRSLLNLVRLVAVAWVLLLTLAIRSGGLPGLTRIVDAGLKGCIIWLLITTVFAFVFYPAMDSARRRGRVFGILTAVGIVVWLASLFVQPLGVARLFGGSFGS